MAASPLPWREAAVHAPPRYQLENQALNTPPRETGAPQDLQDPPGPLGREWMESRDHKVFKVYRAKKETRVIGETRDWTELVVNLVYLENSEGTDQWD